MRWKTITIVLTVLIALFAAAAWTIWSSYDNRFKPWICEAVEQATGRRLTLAGPLHLELGLSPTLVVQDAGFQNAPWASRPEMIEAKRIKIQVELLPLLLKKLVIRDLTLVEPSVYLEIGPSGKTNLPAVASNAPKPASRGKAQPVAFSIQQLVIRQALVSVQDHLNGRSFTLRIDHGTLAAPGWQTPVQVAFDGRLNQVPFKLRGTLGPLASALDPKTPWPLKLSVDAAGARVSAVGNIQNPVTLSGMDLFLKLQGADLGRLVHLFHETSPLTGRFSVSGHVRSSGPDRIQVPDLDAAIGQNRITGALEIDTGAAVADVSLRLHSKKLDLRPLMTGKPGAGRQPMRKHRKLFSKTPFNLSALGRINLSLNIDVDHLLARRLAIDGLAASVHLKNGHLIVGPVNARIGQGRVFAGLDVKPEGRRAEVVAQFTAQQVDLGLMLQKLGVTDSLEGTLDAEVSLHGRGDSVAGVMAGLDGNVLAKLGDAKLPLGALNLVGQDLGAGLLDLLDPFHQKPKRTPIDCAVCDLNIRNGLATTVVLMLDDPQETIVGNGTVNLKTEGLDIRIETRPKQGIGTKETGKLHVSLGALLRPFKLGGTLAHPSLTLDLVRTAETLGTALLGPAGWAYLLISGSGPHSDPCAEALAAVQKARSRHRRSASFPRQVEQKARKMFDRLKGIFQ